jgi:hypothetical protein
MHRFLASMAQIMILAIVSAFMLCASLAVLFYIGYCGLIWFGAPPNLAAALLGFAVFLTTGVLVAVTLGQLRQLRRFSHRMMHGQKSGSFDASNIVLAFADGFLNKKAG